MGLCLERRDALKEKQTPQHEAGAFVCHLFLAASLGGAVRTAFGAVHAASAAFAARAAVVSSLGGGADEGQARGQSRESDEFTHDELTSLFFELGEKSKNGWRATGARNGPVLYPK